MKERSDRSSDRTNDNRKRVSRWIALAALGVPAVALAALSGQGLTVQGLTVQGLTVQGLTVQGLTVQGLTVQGLTVQGLTVQGMSPMGSDLAAAQLSGVGIGSVELRGTTSTSPIVPHVLTSIPGVSTGSGNYISVGGGSAVGHYAVAHLVDKNGLPAEDLDLYIAAEQVDPAPNLFHRADQQDNAGALYVVYQFHKWSGQWVSLCPFNPQTGSASAMPIPEDPSQPNKFILACTATGVASKCARNWGYRPWATTKTWFFNDGAGKWEERDYELRPYYEACKLAAQASYCQDGRSYTKNGTLVDLFDTRQIIWPNAIENPLNAAVEDSRWMFAQEYFVSFDPSPFTSSMRASALQRTRYRELSPVGECGNFAFIDRLEHDHFEDGRWANPLTGTPRIQVFSPTHCTHDESKVGKALPWDCSPCTKEVCRTMPACCSMDPTLPQPVWNAACVAQAAVACQDAGTPWPLGKVWPPPPDPTAPAPIPMKHLLGAGGAVVSVEGKSGPGSSAVVSGWACDPEWPGAAVPVRIYGIAPREQAGTAYLGEVRADAAIDSALAREVSAACDGPGRAYARHGFTFNLPADFSGKVFVYAVDQATPDGPAAPPTLLRNGIVPVPRCAHGEHVAGAALEAGCSACVASICGDGTHGDCCTTAWTDACVAAADACAPSASSAPVNSRVHAAIATGWIEAPVSGTYTFAAAAQPSRVFVNGKKLVDWWSAPGPTEGSIELVGGIRYHLRWDRFQSAPPAGSDFGLTWRTPGTAAQASIPTERLYALAPGAGGGLRATYFADPAFSGATLTRVDPFVELGSEIVPPSPLKLPPGFAPGYSAIWEGEVVPAYSDAYTFYVAGSGNATLSVDGVSLLGPTPVAPPVGGCSHDLCAIGDKLAASTTTVPACHACVDTVCAQDPYCCNGGYLSYYSSEPEWDAKCVAEVSKLCGIECKNPLPSPVSAERRSSAPIALQAGVHYRIRLSYDNATADDTVRLLWGSARQNKEVIPPHALYPEGAAPLGAGSGLNVTYFGTKNEGGGVAPDLDTPLAGGSIFDLSLGPPVGQLGTPVAGLLAAAEDVGAFTPPPPAIVRPRFGEEVFVTGAPQVKVRGIGGLAGGSVSVAVDGLPGETIVPVAPDGSFEAAIPIPAVGTWSLRFVQRTTAAGPTCAAPALCSYPITWPVTVTLATTPAAPPAISFPRDPTHSPNPASNVFQVKGKGTSAPVTVTDLGGPGAAILSPPVIVPDAEGNISGTVTLSDGAGDPQHGWHKLVFTQGGAASRPVFVSVGIRPPTVEFPRTGAEIVCGEEEPERRVFEARGTVPYAADRLGPLYVVEETGRVPLGLVTRQAVIDSQPQPDGSYTFRASVFLGYGKHLLYFFQAPDPPAGATPEEQAAHLRAFASLANTPTSRIEVNVPPPRLQVPRGLAGLLGPAGGGPVIGPAPVPGQGGLNLNILDCGPNQQQPSPLCALPNADVNVRVGERLFTTRANAVGAWSLAAPLVPGWNQVTLAQVIDAEHGGGWSESCPSNTVGVGVATSGGPRIVVPPNITVGALTLQGTAVFYDVTAATAAGDPVPVDCRPPSGSVFPLGRTAVLCTATDPTTGAVGLGHFTVDVVDGPPVIQVPPGGLSAEATSSLGALVSYEITATDAVDGVVPVECAPASPAQFPLDLDTTVSCVATDGRGQTSSATFVVRVGDTTPPDLCALRDLTVPATGPSGAVVTFPTCAKDLVDGPVAVTCDRPSGSLFPVGVTTVTCTAKDRRGNAAVPSSFKVTVGDGRPPKLALPGPITAFATSRNGARVSYVVTAVDDVDPDPTVACTPASGTLFPLGTTTVRCKATDDAGNTSEGQFQIKVKVAWTGLLHPITPDGKARFLPKVPIPLRFELTGASAGIRDLTARLFVAPLDAAGNPGPERAATGLPPGTGNLFYYLALVRQYAMALDTRPLGLGRWQLRVDLGDGERHLSRITIGL